MQRLPVLKGTLDVLVLKAVSWTPLHGFEITSWLEARSEGKLAVEDSAVYQALYRLESRGLIEADWGVTENNRRARYYGITPAGRAHLEVEAERMIGFADALTGILRLGESAS